MMALVHDLAEAQGDSSIACKNGIQFPLSVGDITPREGISKPEKKRLEEVRI